MVNFKIEIVFRLKIVLKIPHWMILTENYFVDWEISCIIDRVYGVEQRIIDLIEGLSTIQCCLWRQFESEHFCGVGSLR